jgi:hypothetical protein
MSYPITGRLLPLYLRSRRAGWIAPVVLAIAGVRRVLVPWTSDTGPFAVMMSLLLVGAAASVVATGLVSPFGDTERSAGGPLPALRITQMLGTALLAAAGLAVAAATGGLAVAASLRDFTGLLGIALLTGVVLGAHRCWTLPLAFAMICSGEVDLGQHPTWAWPTLPASNLNTIGIASALLILGATMVTLNGLPDR